MATSSAQFHENPEHLGAETRDRHRAIVSLSEEIEAVDWYDQRIDATGDDGLRAILRHNRDEEKEHAAMLLEWVRRRDPTWDTMLRRYLFTDLPIDELAALAAEQEAEPSGGDAGARPTSLPIGPHAGKEML